MNIEIYSYLPRPAFECKAVAFAGKTGYSGVRDVFYREAHYYFVLGINIQLMVL